MHSGKTVDQIWMPFGVVGQTGPWMRQVVGFGDWSTGRGNGKYRVPHCNQCGLFTIGNSHCATARLLLVEFVGSIQVAHFHIT